MPLTGKYLKYSPEITLEIFKLVYNKLIELKWAPKEMESARTLWKEFNVYPFLCDLGYGGMKLFGTFSAARHSDSETTVQEILGYDPYTIWEKEFVLPAKWYIRCTDESKPYLNKWTGFNWKYVYIYFDGKNKTHSENIDDGYTEITFDQFKKYVLKSEEVKEDIPEYVECIEKLHGIEIGKIYELKDGLIIGKYGFSPVQFKISSKGAYDQQNQPKSIEKWSVGSYVVLIKEYGAINIGEVHEIGDDYSGNCIDISKSAKHDCLPFKDSCQWFATKSEAEEFAKTLIEPVKRAGFPIEGCCETKSDELEQYLIKTRGTSDSKTTKSKATGIGWNEGSYWWLVDITKSSKRKYHLSDLEVWLDKPKQPLKQAVHCKTQEEWDFVNKKLGNDCKNWFANPAWGNNKSFCISFDDKNQSQTLECYQKAGYQILSFQEWCDLNGYKMENKCGFEVGKWYKVCLSNQFYHVFKFKSLTNNNKDVDLTDDHFDINDNKWKKSNSFQLKYVTEIKELSIEEIQQYLPDDHPDKLNWNIKSNQEFKVGDWVYFIGNDERLCTSYWVKGMIFKIGRIENDSICVNTERGGPSNAINQFRHATSEEIQKHLISIGQIGPLDKGYISSTSKQFIDPSTIDNSEYGLPTEPPSYMYEMELKYKESLIKPKLILSIDDEELPMVNIIKTKTVKQLLNN